MLTYIKSQTQFLNITDPNAQKDHIPVDFGPTLLYVLSQVGKDIGGVEYIMGELLRFLSTPTNHRHDPGLSLAELGDQTVIDLAVATNQTLGDQLDALALGNVDLVQAVVCSASDGVLHQEQDLYHSNGERPGPNSYTVANYVQDYQTVFNLLKNTSTGNILALNNIAGPSICCSWVTDVFAYQRWIATDVVPRTLPRPHNKATWILSSSSSSMSRTLFNIFHVPYLTGSPACNITPRTIAMIPVSRPTSSITWIIRVVGLSNSPKMSKY